MVIIELYAYLMCTTALRRSLVCALFLVEIIVSPRLVNLSAQKRLFLKYWHEVSFM